MRRDRHRLTPSSPARRHFLGLGAAAARKLAVVPFAGALISTLHGREASAHDRFYPYSQDRQWSSQHQDRGSEYHHGRWHYYDPQGQGINTRRHSSSGSMSNAESSRGASGSASSGRGSSSGGGAMSGGGSSYGGSSSSGGSSSGSGGSSNGWSSGNGSSSTVGSSSGGSASVGGSSFPTEVSQLPGSIVVRCFARGTLIQTAEGEVPIEQLAVGTQVITPGSRRPVKWVARQTLHRDPGSSWHPRALPVRIARHAIDDQTPTRDLCVSQEHGILVDGVLIPARHLVNGDTIAFDERALDADAIEYFHVELETHDIIFAEGTAAETFHYEGGMIAWDNLVEYEARYGEHRKMERSIPFMSYDGGLDELRGLLRLAASRVIDVRDPIQRAYDRLAARARLMKRAA